MEFSFDTQTEYLDQTFKRVQCRNKTIESKTFENCTFVSCSFNEVVFQSCIFRDCTFQDCNLWLTHVPGSAFKNTMFKKSKAVGINWVEGAWSKKGLLESIGFIECDITNSTFIGLELRKMMLSKCIAQNVDFADANLSQANCTDTDFGESRFMHTNLTEADFTGAFHYAIDASQNTLKKAKFSLPEAINILRCMNIVLVE